LGHDNSQNTVAVSGGLLGIFQFFHCGSPRRPQDGRLIGKQLCLLGLGRIDGLIDFGRHFV
jgi:hypothetical protein